MQQLPREHTKEAVYDELACFCEHIFRGISHDDEAADDLQGKITRSQWSGARDNFCAATPPLEAKRLLFSEWATKKVRHGKRLKLSLVDI